MMFVWIGAAVEIPRKVHKLLGTLGPKLYFYRMNLRKKNEEHKLKTQVKELTKKNNEKEFMLNVAMMQKDKEVEHLRQQEIINKDSIMLLSDQIALLMTKMHYWKINKTY